MILLSNIILGNGLRMMMMAQGARGFFSTTPAVLPDLPYDYNALEPFISAEIMKLHHSAHHKAYVDNYNLAMEENTKAVSKNDMEKMVSLQALIKFNAGGHINHSIFWKNLCPHSQFQELGSDTNLYSAVLEQYGSVEELRKALSAKGSSVQGSGWAWLGYCKERNRLVVTSTQNQDPLSSVGLVPLLGIDVWEHAYYLQYKNVRGDYLKNIWNVINWKVVAERYDVAARK